MTARNRGKLFLGLCLAGFLPGIIYANTGSREYILSMEILSDAFLEQYADVERTGGFLLYILAVRVSLLGGLVLLGQARRLRRLAAGAVLLWTGFLGGLFITAALIRLGPSGILFCMAALLPQAFFYAVGYGIILWHFFSCPEGRWNSAKTAGVAVALGTGILCESYLNPIFLNIFLKTI